MTAAELVRYLTNALFIVVFISVARSALHERNRSSLDTTLLFGAIALVIAEGQVTAALGARNTVLTAASLLLLLALPYLQLRLVEDFAGVRPLLMRLCVAGIAVAAVVGVAAGTGVVDLTAAAGPALSLILLVALTGQIVGPAVSSAATTLLGFVSAAAFAAAFAPPAILRRAWREPALRSFFSSAAAISPLESRADIVAKLEAGAVRATSARAAHVVLRNGDGPLVIDPSGESPLPVSVAQDVFASQRAQLAVGEGSAVLAAPISGRGRQLGVLAVTGRRAPLFASDDLDLVQLLADQAAIVLDGARLYEELASANRELSEATRVKSEFLANMSHELRTPLNAILGFSGLLTEQIGASLTDRQQRFLHNIEEAGQHLLELINDVLDLSKVEAGKLELRPEVIGLDALLEPVCAAARASAQSKGISFEVQSQASEGLLLDPTRVRQVLFNLVSNAVKFTPPGGSVHLRALLDGPDLLVAVADTGIGIPADARDRVFGVFERLHEGRVKAEGTGLGLALTKRLVEQMGGSITFESEDGRGTTFRVTLPDVRTEPVLGQRILVVEDERHDADLIVAVAGSPRGQRIPAIVVTVEGEPARALGLGADDYLTKPIDRARLERWLTRACGATAPPPAPTDRREHAHSPR